MNIDADKKVLDQMERELHKPRTHDVPDEPLFHYTDSNGLLGILSTKQIWATHHAHVNDTEEIIIGERTVDIVAERFLAETPADTPARWLLENFVKLHKLNGQSLTKITGVYISSFSDRGNQLSQWRGYAARGAGYSIGIREFRLPRDDSVEAELALILMKCEYNQEVFTHKVEQVLMEVVDGFEAYVRAFSINVDVFNALMLQALSIALRRVALLIPALKNSQFEEEREWRLVAIPMRDYKNKIVRYRPGPNGIVPYIPIDLAEDGEPLKLEKIYVGPRQDPGTGVGAATAFLASHGYERPQLVEHSRIPFRA